MVVKTKAELDRAAYLKAVRTAIRLKHSLAADAEIAETLPREESRYNEALAKGTPLRLSVGEVIDRA